jgi:hypothetical protein
VQNRRIAEKKATLYIAVANRVLWRAYRNESGNVYKATTSLLWLAENAARW